MVMQILIALDQLLNALTGGWADETFSARCWRRRNRGWGWAALVSVIDALAFLQKNHCESSYNAEILRLQSPPEERDNKVAQLKQTTKGTTP